MPFREVSSKEHNLWQHGYLSNDILPKYISPPRGFGDRYGGCELLIVGWFGTDGGSSVNFIEILAYFVTVSPHEYPFFSCQSFFLWMKNTFDEKEWSLIHAGSEMFQARSNMNQTEPNMIQMEPDMSPI